jgi:hypothetical protein
MTGKRQKKGFFVESEVVRLHHMPLKCWIMDRVHYCCGQPRQTRVTRLLLLAFPIALLLPSIATSSSCVKYVTLRNLYYPRLSRNGKKRALAK